MSKRIKPLVLAGFYTAILLLPLAAAAGVRNMVPAAPRLAVADDNAAVTRTVKFGRQQTAALQESGTAGNSGTPHPGDTLVYAFFDNAVYTVTVTRVSNVYGNASLVTGLCQGAPAARFQAVFSADGVRHELHDFSRARLYQATGSGLLIEKISEIDDTRRLPKTDLAIPIGQGGSTPDEAGVANTARRVAANSSGSIIDIMILFDSTAKTWADGNGGMTAIANAAIDKLNTALENSGANFSYRLVHVQTVSYTHSGNLGTDLTTLGSGYSALGAATAAARNTYGADIVSMLVDTGSAYGTVGLGYFPTSAGGDAGAAFSVCSIRSVDISHTLSHELGHNLGADHSKFQPADAGPGLFSYAAGWFFKGNDNVRYHTIMSYETDNLGRSYIECDYFSTPLVTFQGVAVGNAADGDNVRCINFMAPIVAAYRASTLPIAATPQFSPPHGTVFHSTLAVAITTGTAGADIRYTVDGSQPIASSMLYTNPVPLAQTTTLRAKAFKTGFSDSATATATYTLMAPCEVTFDAQGGTAPIPASMIVTNGQPYGLMAATTREGYIFIGWYNNPSFSGAPVTASSTVSTDNDHTLYARWEQWTGGLLLCPAAYDDELSTIGSFDGFFYENAMFNTSAVTSVRGTLALKLTSLAGRLTAKAILQSGNLSFAATQWDTQAPDGTRMVAITARSGETLQLKMRQQRVWGKLNGGRLGDSELVFDGGRNRFADRRDAGAAALLAQFRGAYTVALPPHATIANDPGIDGAPLGAGYLSLAIGISGSTKIAGTLADGTRITRSTRLIPYSNCGELAAVPLFVPLYAKRGWTGGLLWVAPQGAVVTDRESNWFIRWENPGRGPDGFTALLDACGGFYTPAMASAYLLTAEGSHPYWHNAGSTAPVAIPEDVQVTTAGGRLMTARSARPKLMRDGLDTFFQYDALNPANAAISFAARTGIFRGTFMLYYDYSANGSLLHKAVRVTYSGIFIPLRGDDFLSLPDAIGYWLAPDNSPNAMVYRLKRSYPISLTAE